MPGASMLTLKRLSTDPMIIRTEAQKTARRLCQPLVHILPVLTDPRLLIMALFALYCFCTVFVSHPLHPCFQNGSTDAYGYYYCYQYFPLHKPVFPLQLFDFSVFYFRSITWLLQITSQLYHILFVWLSLPWWHQKYH
jgi:hypothetical protein